MPRTKAAKSAGVRRAPYGRFKEVEEVGCCWAIFVRSRTDSSSPTRAEDVL
jgi:hypothetical protein